MGIYQDAAIAITIAIVIGLTLLVRAAKTVPPGWKYELISGGRVVRVLDKPGLWFVNPFLTVRPVRLDPPLGDSGKPG